jgi:3-oxoacyl-[acyl-carrier-protein] synthase-3
MIWIQERTGIQERRHIIRGEDTTTSMGVKAAEIAIERSGWPKKILILLFLQH